MTFTGKSICDALDNALADKYDFGTLTNREKEIFFLGMEIAADAMEYIKNNNIVLQGSATSTATKDLCLEICQQKKTIQNDYILRQVQALAKCTK